MNIDLGLVGLGTMGRNLALNLVDHGVRVWAWNLEDDVADRFVAEQRSDALRSVPSLRAMVPALEPPRRILLMISAGRAVDEVLDELMPLLDPGDIVIDGGNTHFEDTRRRAKSCANHGVELVGLGVSGGEQGARHGPSLMVGGSESAWAALREPLTAIAATSAWGPCAARCGPDGAGHFVKMVHNGIEYADMQLIAEIFDLLRADRADEDRIADVFAAWNSGALQSYLIELTAQVLRKKNPVTGDSLVRGILDVAEQKGTGRWTVQTAVDIGVPVPGIAAAVDARIVSSHKHTRAELARDRVNATVKSRLPAAEVLEQGLWFAKLCTYIQGIALLQTGSRHFDWGISIGAVARLWTGGCIIRARLLDDVIAVFDEDPNADFLLHPFCKAAINDNSDALRECVRAAVEQGIPAPALSASLAWIDGMTRASLPQNLIQAQRDAFGAHTYRLTDDPDTPVHTDWTK